jgi:omega-hydroxy-beta-dihydromenaquinone-9 sulfotransferase
MSQNRRGTGVGAKPSAKTLGKPGKGQRSGRQLSTIEPLAAGKQFASASQATTFSVFGTPMHQNLKPAQTERRAAKTDQTDLAYPAWSPLFWHGMSFSTWMRLLWRNRFAVTPRRIPFVAGITGASMFHSFGGIFERLLLSHKVNQTKLAQPPLFVLGHWRSGTTLLHELLILDKRHTYPTTYECLVPHHFLWTEWFFPPISNWMLPAKRLTDSMAAGWDHPQEDEFALANLGIPSPYLAWAFPNHGPVNDEYLDLASISAAERERWKRALRRFVHRVATLRNGRIVLKSPTHTARVSTLLEIFPDARFVHIVRDPLAVYPSTVRLWTKLCETQGLQTIDGTPPWVEPQVLDTFARMYARFERDRELIPAGRLAEIRFEELTADPVGQMRQVYEQLDLGEFERARPAIAEYAATHRDHPVSSYSLPPATAERLRRHLAPYFERYGYAEPAMDSVSA